MNDLVQVRARVDVVRDARATIDRKGTLVIGSDGLFKYASVDALADAVRTATDAASASRQLGSIGRTPSGTYHDDLAVVVLQLDAARSVLERAARVVPTA